MLPSTPDAARAIRPRPLTVFAAAIVAGTAVAVGVNVVLDAHLAQARPQVESEVILVAMRGLPPGSPVTVWDVALRDWPKAMVPAAALRVGDHLDDLVVRHPLREGQPVLATQVARVSSEPEGEEERPAWSIVSGNAAERTAPEQDLWDPGPPPRAPAPPRPTRPATVTTPVAKVTSAPPRALEVQPVVVPARDVVAPAAPATAPLAVAPESVAPPTTPPVTPPVAVAPAEPILAAAPPATPVPPPAPMTIARETAPAATNAVPEAPGAPPAPIDVAPAGEPTPRTAAARRAEPAARVARPHPSAVQFLAVPEPESFLADDDPAALPRRRTTVTPRGGRDVSVVERGIEDARAPTTTPAPAPTDDVPRTAQAAAPRPARPVTPPRAPQRASRGAAARGYRAY